MRFFDNHNIRDFKTCIILKRDDFFTFKYIVQYSEDLLLYRQSHNNKTIGLEPINKKNIYFKIKREIKSKDPYLT
jgi:hypothetical protein